MPGREGWTTGFSVVAHAARGVCLGMDSHCKFFMPRGGVHPGMTVIASHPCRAAACAQQ